MGRGAGGLIFFDESTLLAGNRHCSLPTKAATSFNQTKAAMPIFVSVFAPARFFIYNRTKNRRRCSADLKNEWLVNDLICLGAIK